MRGLELGKSREGANWANFPDQVALTALNLIRSIACERLSQDSTLERSEGDPVASSCLHRLMPQLSSDFTARSDLNTFRRLATDVKHRVSREPVYGGFGARVYPQSSPEESELAVTSDAEGEAAEFGERRLRFTCICVCVYT